MNADELQRTDDQKMLLPTSEEDLSGIVRASKRPLAIQGGKTRGVVIDGDALGMAGLSGITTYEPGALTLVAKAGTPMAEIEAALKAEGQMLAFEPTDPRVALNTAGASTIGGVVATNDSGSRRVLSGACRDFLLGVRFVDGKGDVISNGGRVMKNVTGYDLSRLMCGAHGTLGILSEVSLKVLPKPESQRTLTLPSLGLTEAVQAMSKALATPYEVSGAFFDFAKSGDVHLRVEGLESSVNYRIEKLSLELAEFSGRAEILDRAESKSLWAGIKDAAFLQDVPFVIRASVNPTAVVDMMKRKVLNLDCHFDWGGGRLWISAGREQLQEAAESFDDERKGDPVEAALMALDLIRGELGFDNGHATLIKADPAVWAQAKRFQSEPASLSFMAAELRRMFDPHGILNPGLMG